MRTVTQYADAVYEFLLEHAETVDGKLVCDAPIYPWLMKRLSLDIRQVKGVRTAVVKELDRRGLVQRPNPRKVRVIILDSGPTGQGRP